MLSNINLLVCELLLSVWVAEYTVTFFIFSFTKHGPCVNERPNCKIINSFHHLCNLKEKAPVIFFNSYSLCVKSEGRIKRVEWCVCVRARIVNGM